MAFEEIPSDIIEAGDPVTQDLFSKVKNSFDDHETRLLSVEGGGNVNYFPLFWHVNGVYPEVHQDCGIIRIPFAITIQAARLMVHTAGTSGGTEIDMLYKRGTDPWTTIFSTRPSVNFSDGDYGISTNQIVSVTSLTTGDLLRMDITARQDGQARGLLGILEFEKT